MEGLLSTGPTQGQLGCTAKTSISVLADQCIVVEFKQKIGYAINGEIASSFIN